MCQCQDPFNDWEVGGGRHGDASDKALLAYHMRHCKGLKKQSEFRESVSQVLSSSTFRRNGKVISISAKATSSGLLIQLDRMSTKGNRFKRAVPWAKFLDAAYGKLQKNTHIAASLDLSRGMALFMGTMVSAAYLSEQTALLTKVVALVRSSKPLLCIKQYKWDETQWLTSVNPNHSESRVQSSWQVMVARERIVIVWPDGSCLILRLVLPPVVLLGSAAHHMFHAMKNHASYKQTNVLLDLVAENCARRVAIYESDGAYANERLVAHLLNKDKNNPVKQSILHFKCANHATQLVNVAVLAAIDQNILSRLYGMTVYLRQLGHWFRLKEAVFNWVNEHLDFNPRLLGGNLSCQQRHHPATLEMIDFMRCNRKLQSEKGETSSAFEQAVENFLDMFNGDTTMDRPCHYCSHPDLPPHERHCKDRAEAVKRGCGCLGGTFHVCYAISSCTKQVDDFILFSCTQDEFRHLAAV
ncbi:Uncharacterized protein SCF082_LOCUS47154 [Durusdinium trenchii]|uniref:DUF659 domain-containing protein n=1 Tax=Durusdinium trenchii TaxID=1381693 RepID=A0ABP0RNL0_9DINO